MTAYATWLNRAGVPLQVIQKMLGHASIETTTHYAHAEVTAAHAAQIDAALASRLVPEASHQAGGDPCAT